VTQVRVAVIGAGAIAQVAHLPALAGRDDVEIVGICDNDASKARALASRLGIANSFEDIEELLKHARPDAVAICTPNHLHEVHTLTALSAGAAVLCERPLALTVEGIERIVAARHSAQRPVMVGMNHRFRNDIQAVRSFTASGELGTLRALRTGWYQFRASRSGPGWRQRQAEAGGGAMLDLGLPLLDLALWLANRRSPLRVTAALHRSPGGGVEDGGSAYVVSEDGCSLSIDVAWRYVGDRERAWLDVLGEKGSARVSPLRVFKEINGTPRDVTPTGAAGRENVFSASYRAEWATFLAVARQEVDPPALDDQLALHRTMDAVYLSAREGRTVTV